MCGIIGMVSDRNVRSFLIDGLKRLEYRGYDSSGIATVNSAGEINCCRAAGKLSSLEKKLQNQDWEGFTGIGHTRWATHGKPLEKNAHPLMGGRSVAVVHNGIIENFSDIRSSLEREGVCFSSDTDTEVIAWLVSQELKRGNPPLEAVLKSLSCLKGAFALGFVFEHFPGLLIASRRGSPLAVGHGNKEMFIGSDAFALSGMAHEVTFLEDGDIAVLQRESVSFYNEEGQEITRPSSLLSAGNSLVDKGGYRHYMLKEIHEQPRVVGDAFETFLQTKTILEPYQEYFKNVSRLTLSACGTSFYACQVAKYWIEKYAALPVEIDVASEFRYRHVPFEEGGLAIFVSQSGETADTLAALRHAKAHNQTILSIVNVVESTIARESDILLQTCAGPEIGVASTKAFTTQLMVLGSLILSFAHIRGHLSQEDLDSKFDCFRSLPSILQGVLAKEPLIASVARTVSDAQDVLYLGRGDMWPVAMEGALKLKEISYIHAEGYPAGEMKHGPIALIDECMQVIVVAPFNDLFDKVASNIQEVIARRGHVILLSSQEGADAFKGTSIQPICLPRVSPLIAPIVYALPLQLLAYHIAVIRGTDVDQPRNLAKSVTVE